MTELYHSLKQFGHVKINEPLAKHTTFKIGGPADFLVAVEETAKLVALLKFLDGDGIPYVVIGGGSNVLARDEGFRGVAIKIQTKNFKIYGATLEAEAGCITVEMAQQSIKAGLTGFEWGVGVPGTIGGAVRGNAGAMGGEMSDVVYKVTAYQDGEVVELSHPECRFGYRDSIFKHGGGIVLKVWLPLQNAENKDGMKKAMEHLQYRMKTQPQGHSSIGCIFKNIELKGQTFSFDIPEEFMKKGRIPAGWLVEKAGMKGVSQGKVVVSDRHGNFVLNMGGATAHEVLELVEQIKARVYDTCGVAIEEEIYII